MKPTNYPRRKPTRDESAKALAGLAKLFGDPPKANATWQGGVGKTAYRSRISRNDTPDQAESKISARQRQGEFVLTRNVSSRTS
jgi:hypothetical protein